MIFPPARKGARNHLNPLSCFYCNKAFDSHRALGGHLRVHQPGRLSKAKARLARLARYRKLYRDFPMSIANFRRLLSSSSFPATRATSFFGYPRVFRSNGMNHTHRCTSSGSNPELDVSLNISLGSSANVNVIYQSSCFSSTASALIGGPSAISGTSIALPSGSVGTRTPLDLSLHVGSGDNNFSNCRDGLPSLGDAGRNIIDQSPGKLLYSAFSLTNPDRSGGSYQSPSFKEHAAVGGFSPGLHRYSGIDVGHHDPSNALSDSIKRLNLGEGSSDGGAENALKKPKNIFSLTMESEEPRNKDLLYLVDVDSSISASEALDDAKDQVYLDLSLHL